MNTRYINTSEKTTHIAKGLLLYARYMNMSYADARDSKNPARQEWHQWCDAQPEDWVTLVMKLQNELFDHCQDLT